MHVFSNAQRHEWVLVYTEKFGSPIFIVPFNYVKFDIVSETVEIGVAFIFFNFTPANYKHAYIGTRTSPAPKYGNQIPNFSYFTPQTMLPKMRTKNWCVFLAAWFRLANTICWELSAHIG